jgi:hypothetical protein
LLTGTYTSKSCFGIRYDALVLCDIDGSFASGTLASDNGWQDFRRLLICLLLLLRFLGFLALVL